MLDLLEIVAGAVVLAAYLGVAIVLPVAVIVLFIRLIGVLLGVGMDALVGALKDQEPDVRLASLRASARWLRAMRSWSRTITPPATRAGGANARPVAGGVLAPARRPATYRCPPR